MTGTDSQRCVYFFVEGNLVHPYGVDLTFEASLNKKPDEDELTRILRKALRSYGGDHDGMHRPGVIPSAKMSASIKIFEIAWRLGQEEPDYQRLISDRVYSDAEIRAEISSARVGM